MHFRIATSAAYAQRQKWSAPIEFNMRPWMIQYAKHEMCDSVSRTLLFYSNNPVCIECQPASMTIGHFAEMNKNSSYDSIVWYFRSSQLRLFFSLGTHVGYIKSMHAERNTYCNAIICFDNKRKHYSALRSRTQMPNERFNWVINCVYLSLDHKFICQIQWIRKLASSRKASIFHTWESV